MKASETSERYAGKVRECCNYASRSSKTFATGGNNKKRQPCGEDEKVLASNLKAQLSGFCDTVSEDTFSASRQAYVLSNLLVFIFMLLSAAAAICGFFIDDILLIVSIILSVLALLGYFGVFGGTSKSGDEVNIFATRNCSGDVKNRIIIEANLDAPFKRTIKPKTEKLLKFLNLLSILLYLTFDIVEVLITYQKISFNMDDKFVYLAFPLALFAFIPLILSRSVNANASFPGVSDNLIGCYTACGALRYMSEMDLRLHHTELCVLLTGGKNANLAGAKNYCKLHGSADKEINTSIISIDTVYSPDTITVISNSSNTTDILALGAKNADVQILSTKPKKITKYGSAKVFKKNGIASATITSLGEPAPEFLGTADDNADTINVKAIESVMKIILESAYAQDSK